MNFAAGEKLSAEQPRLELAELTAHAAETAILCDIDGTLAPIVTRAEEAMVPAAASRLLAGLAGRYALVACVSGRTAADARRLVGVGGITYAGSHGAELLRPGARTAEAVADATGWSGRVRAFVDRQEIRDLRELRVRIEDKDPIWAFHWRGAPDEERAAELVDAIAAAALEVGLATHWGRKVLEIRPPVSFDKGQAVARMIERAGCRRALYVGDDLTDLDAFAALAEMAREGTLTQVVRVGVASDEAPPAIVDEADIVVAGTPGVLELLGVLAGE